MKAIDPKNTGFIGLDDLVTGFKAFDANLTYQETYTLLRFFDTK